MRHKKLQNNSLRLEGKKERFGALFYCIKFFYCHAARIGLQEFDSKSG
jgi:hypothetical protein